MPFLTQERKVAEVKSEDVYYPEIKWLIDGKDHEKYVPHEYYGLPSVKKEDVLTVVIEQAPRNRTIRYRHQFQRGDKYTEYYLSIPWEYYIARVSPAGIILLSAMFFSNEELKKTDQEGLCGAPLPNNDYGRDKGLGVCLWKSGASFGKDPKKAAMKAHEYIWTSVFNPGVNYYDGGRPEEIQASSWPASLEKWQELTKAGKAITWKPVQSKELHRLAKTLDDAFEWLSLTRDHLYQ